MTSEIPEIAGYTLDDAGWRRFCEERGMDPDRIDLLDPHSINAEVDRVYDDSGDLREGK
jgi:hypothetical protein